MKNQPFRDGFEQIRKAIDQNVATSNFLYLWFKNCWVFYLQLLLPETYEIHFAVVVFWQPVALAEITLAMLTVKAKHRDFFWTVTAFHYHFFALCLWLLF